jgi:hypothetical protein
MAFFPAIDNLFDRFVHFAIQEFCRVRDGRIAIRKLVCLVRRRGGRQPCHGHSGN